MVNDVTISFQFDSSHFNDGDLITITLTGNNTLNKNTTFKNFALVWNKGYVLSNSAMAGYTWPQIAAVVAADLQPNMHHTQTTATTALGGDKATLLSNMPTYTVLYAGTHGQTNLTSYLGDLLTTVDGQGTYMSCADVTAAIATKGVIPRYNFVHMDACQTGSGSAMSAAFGIPDTAGTDHACLCPSNVINVDAMLQTWSTAVWQNLMQGQTVNTAVGNANGPQNQNVPNSDDWDAATGKYDLLHPHGAIYAIYGDQFNATVYDCVYRGQAGQWHN